MTDADASKQRYHTFIDAACAEAGIAEPRLMYENCNFEVNDVTFTLMHADFIHPDLMILSADFGKPAAEQRDLVLQRLLESNLYMYCDSDGPAFSFNAENGHVVLMSRLTLEAATPAFLLALTRQLSVYVKTWQKTFFMSDEERKAGKGKRVRSTAASILQKTPAMSSRTPA